MLKVICNNSKGEGFNGLVWGIIGYKNNIFMYRLLEVIIRLVMKR